METGAGDLGVFALQVGRWAIPVVRKYVPTVATQLGKLFSEATIPEFGQD